MAAFTHSHALSVGGERRREYPRVGGHDTYVKMEAIVFGHKCEAVRSEVDNHS